MKKIELVLLMLFGGISLFGQSMFKIPEKKSAIVGWQYEHTSFDFVSDDYHLRFFDGFHQLTMGAFLSDNVLLLGQFPVAFYELTTKHTGYRDIKRYESTIGNPSLSFYMVLQKNSFLFTRLSIPLVSDNRFQTFLFRYSSNIDMLESFYPKIWSVRLGLNKDIEVNKRFFVRNLAVFKLLFPSGKDYYFFPLGKPEKWIQLQTSITIYPFKNKMAFHTGMSGFFWISQNNLNISELSFFYFNNSVSLNLGDLKPELFFRLPIDKPQSDFLKIVFGFKIIKTL